MRRLKRVKCQALTPDCAETPAVTQYTTSLAVVGAKGLIVIAFAPGVRCAVTSRRNGAPMNPPAKAPLTVTCAAASGAGSSSTR